MAKHIVIERLTLAVLVIATLSSTGCVNLDDRPGTSVTRAPIKKTPEAMLKATKSTGNSFVKRVKNVLPKKRPTSQIQDNPITADDPTRLDNKPGLIGPDLYIAAARLSEQNGRYDAALEQYNSALKSDGRNRNALIGMARLHHRAGNLDASIRIYRDALNIYRNDAVIMNDLGLCYARKGQTNEAISMLQAATQASPDREMYMNNLAAALVDANRMGEAVAHLTNTNGPAVANYKVGYLLDRAGRKAEAEPYLSQALSIDPGLRQARALLDANAPQVSSLPQDMVRGGYQIPVSNPSAPSLQRPDEVSRPAGDIPAVAPSAKVPSHLKNQPNRFGPFGYTHPRRLKNEVQVVSYVEPVSETGQPELQQVANARQLQPVSTH